MRNLKWKSVIFVLSIVMMFNTNIVFGKGNIEVDETVTEDVILDEIENPIEADKVSFGNITETYKYFKVSASKAGSFTVDVSGLNSQKRAASVLYDGNKNKLSDTYTIRYTKPSARYFVEKAGTYYIKLRCTAGYTATASCTFVASTLQGGSSFSKATVIKKTGKKSGVLGFETPINTKQYYKITVPSEQTVAIQCTKTGSCSPTDTFYYQVFKSGDLNNPIDWGGIYEGQGKATLYIRNSPKHQALPGTYYIAVYKIIQKSSFAYSLTWK